MTTANKLKTASKLGTLVLAATVYVFLGSNQSGVEVKEEPQKQVTVLDTTYQTIPQEDGGPSDPQMTGTREQLKSTVCPGDGQLCAVAINPPNPEDQIFWDGGSNKF